MTNKEVKLLGVWQSPFVLRLKIALTLKSIEYEFIEEPMYPKSELLLKSNPIHKKIPVLFHDDKPICESLIILQYIDEAFPFGPSILPSDPYDRAIQRFWAVYIDDKWLPSLQELGKAQSEEAKAAALEQVKESLTWIEDAFGKCSKGKPFFGGDKIEYLDIAFGCHLGWLRVVEKMSNVSLINQEKTPNLLAWVDKFCADEAVKDNMPETDELIEIAKALMARFKAAAST